MKPATGVLAAALLAASLLPGCGSTGTDATPAAAPSDPAATAAPAAAPAPVPEKSPIPILALEAGARHAFRHELTMRMRFPENEVMGTVEMNAKADAVHTVLSGSPSGEGRIVSLIERVQGLMAMPAMGFKMEIDSDNEAQMQSVLGKGPFAPLKVILGSVGVPRHWTLRRRRIPESEEGVGPSARRGGKNGQDGESQDLFAVMIPMTWLDLLPDAPFDAEGRGRVEGDLSALGRMGRNFEGASWSVEAWDPATGIAEFAIQGSTRDDAAPAKDGEARESFIVEFRDRFDVKRGRYLSRRMTVHGEAPPGAFGPGGPGGPDGGRALIELEIRAERLPDPPPAETPPR